MLILDTDVAMDLLRGRAPGVLEHLRGLGPRDVATTSITAAELRYGACHSSAPARNLERVRDFLAPLAQFPFDDGAATHYAQIKHQSASKGRLIGPVDLLIAATALSHGATLVTNDLREFTRVPGLAVERWSD